MGGWVGALGPAPRAEKLIGPIVARTLRFHLFAVGPGPRGSEEEVRAKGLADACKTRPYFGGWPLLKHLAPLSWPPKGGQLNGAFFFERGQVVRRRGREEVKKK